MSSTFLSILTILYMVRLKPFNLTRYNLLETFVCNIFTRRLRVASHAHIHFIFVCCPWNVTRNINPESNSDIFVVCQKMLNLPQMSMLSLNYSFCLLSFWEILELQIWSSLYFFLRNVASVTLISNEMKRLTYKWNT